MHNVHDSARAPRHVGLLAACAMAVLLLTGCNTPGWVPDAVPAGGVDLTVGKVELRNLVLVADDSGKTVLFGAGHANQADRLVGTVLVPIAADATETAPISVPKDLEFPKGSLTQTNLVFSDPDLKPGLSAEVTLIFETGGTATTTVPIYASDHPDFAAAYSQAVANA